MPEAHCTHCREPHAGTQFFGEPEYRRSLDGLQIAEVHHRAGCDVPRHAHTSAFVSVLLTGRYQSRFGNTVAEFEPGRAVWHEGGFDHEDSIAEGGARFLCVEVDDRRLACLRDYHPRSPLSQTLDDRASFALLRLFAANRASDDDLSIEALGAEFLGLMCEPDCSADEGRAPWLDRVCDRITCAPGDRASLSELAAIAAVHPSHLARSFRARFGCSVGEYARAYRLTRAWHLLAGRRLPVAEVAYSLGYADQSHFTREFSRQLAIPPARARRLLRQGGAVLDA